MTIRMTSALLAWMIFSSCADSQPIVTVESPDGRLQAVLSIDQGKLYYRLQSGKESLLGPSRLGLETSRVDFSQDLVFDSCTSTFDGFYDYNLPLGRQTVEHKPYRERTIYVKNRSGQRLGVVFRLSDDGAAFAYHVDGTGCDTVLCEYSGVGLRPEARGYLQPLAAGKTGWARTNPGYEEGYVAEVVPGTPSEFGQGWVFPSLFRSGEYWLLISETGVDGGYVASHLSDSLVDGNLHVAFAHADNNGPEDPVTPIVTLPFTTPWRTIVVGRTPERIVESTLFQDLVWPRYRAGAGYAPGKAVWSWLVEDDPGTTFENSIRYIDLAAKLGFRYCLIDALWDTRIGRSRMSELARHAAMKNVKLILWYNSNGSWNDAPQGPLHRMDTREARREELQWLRQTGISGIKVDFFGGDKQQGMRLYEDLLTDANDFGISVNLHGSTLPRGWDRMFPNMVTAEAIRGMEASKYDAAKEAARPFLSTVAVFTRNAVGPMDFTPTVLNAVMGIHGNRIPRVTTATFELALPVVFHSPIQHLGIVPENLSEFPNFVWDYLRDVPTVWDETRCLSGYPGRDAVLARRKGGTWYVAGINGESCDNKQFDLVLPTSGRAELIRDKAGNRNAVERLQVDIPADGRISLSVPAYGGFVLVIR